MSDVIPPRRRKVAPLVIVTGVAATLLLAFATTGALAGFTASIQNNANTASSGTLLMTETQGGTTCLSSAAGTVSSTNSNTCAINKFGGQTTMVPGGTPVTASVTILNNGTVPANTFTLTPSGCTVSNNGSNNGTDTAGFCGKMDLTIGDTTTGKCIFPVSASPCAAPTSSNTVASLGTTAISLTAPLAAGASRSYTFTLQLDSSATNADQGLTANDTLTWAFAS